MHHTLLTNGLVQLSCCAVALALPCCAAEKVQPANGLTIKHCDSSSEVPAIHGAIYTKPSGIELLGPSNLSEDGGNTWSPFRPTPDFSADLPYGYRREPMPGVLDPKTGRIVTILNAMDTPGLDPKSSEPAICRSEYYLRYRVSIDGGRTYLFDEPIVQVGHTIEHAFDGVSVGRNGILMGDIGCIPIFTRNDKLLVPASAYVVDDDGRLSDAGGGETYEDVVILVGEWDADNRLKWVRSPKIAGNPKLTTRGLSEATLAELPDGRILAVMRGSNGGSKDPTFELPSYKWTSVSKDGGATWSKPRPLKFDTKTPLFSPSSMSQLLVHSTGRVFWIGNVNPSNSQRNNWRWPLIICEVDTASLTLRESSILTLDSRRSDDPAQLDISHFRAIEDRRTGDIMITAPRYLDGYKRGSWNYFRVGV